jgi:ABC-type transport system involved in cytochrome c biogenesis permease subunit
MSTLRKYLMPLASLKLTVVLLAMSAFIVLAGTLAQVNQDVWEAVRQYFRIDMRALVRSSSIGEFLNHLFVWIKLDIFKPPAFFPGAEAIDPKYGFWFPRGWTIGAVMMVNLLAAHSLRFKVQSRGGSLFAGLGVILLGAVLTWAVIVTASSADGIQTNTVVSYGTVWQLMGLAKLAISGCLVYLGLADGNTSRTRWLYLISAVLAALLSAVILLAPPLEDPSMRILYQLLKGTVCGVVLLAGCWLVFQKRAGVVLLHSGVGMLMVYEILVGLNAGTMEASMQITEGQTAFYTTDIRSSELAIADLSDAKEDVETIIPGTLLQKGQKYEDKQLPFVVELLDYYPHSTLFNKVAKFNMSRPGQPADEPKEPADVATTGLGKTFRITPLDPSVGTDTSGRVDSPSGYVRLTDRADGKEIGTFLATTVLFRAEPFEHKGKKYELELRYRRTYTPFHVTLKDVQKNVYVGTDRPRDFRSIVTLKDVTNGVTLPDFEIWMNNPLRYGGFTFYQSNYDAGRDGREVTSLQVVENEGWTIPYIACMITAVGLLFQFVLTLTRFLGKLGRSTDTLADFAEVDAESGRSRWVAASVAGLLFVICLYPAVKSKKPAEGFDLAAFGQIPIFYEGRPQPIDSLARNSMLFLNDRETYSEKAADSDKKVTQPAVRWMLDVITDSPQASKHAVFQIENIELQKALGLERVERFRYPAEAFEKKLEAMSEEIEKLADAKTESLNLYQRKLLSLARRVRSVRKLEFMFVDPTTIQPIPQLPHPDTIQANPAAAQEQVQGVREYLGRLTELASGQQFAIVVPMHIKAEPERLSQAMGAKWTTFPEAAAFTSLEAQFQMEPAPAMKLWKAILDSYKANKPAEFNQHVADYLKLLSEASEKDRTAATGAILDTKKTAFEHAFNRIGPFNLASYFYVGAFVLVALGWVGSAWGWMKPLHTAAFAFALLTFDLHSLAIVGRIYISGRPPVTNLYSAAVFIGCAACLFALACEPFIKRGIGTTLACLSGYLSLRVAYALTTDGDTFAVLQAVLDTQFWLATHVVTITLGYATTYVSGMIAVAYIIGGVCTPAFAEKDRNRLVSMMYGTQCFAIFFSFVGTVLGGLWADDSWGRFWGWDPKENGALIIVLWNALVLHARWGGMVRERGMAALCVLGNIVVSWSFFGVNELGVGLHAYGLTEGRIRWLALFAVSQLAITALALLPKSAWWSLRAHPDGEGAPKPPSIEPMV